MEEGDEDPPDFLLPSYFSRTLLDCPRLRIDATLEVYKTRN